MENTLHYFALNAEGRNALRIDIAEAQYKADELAGRLYEKYMT
jgi:hypothetical protein